METEVGVVENNIGIWKFMYHWGQVRADGEENKKVGSGAGVGVG